MTLPLLLPALPEILLALFALILVPVGAFLGKKAFHTIFILSFFAFTVVLVLVLFFNHEGMAFYGQFKADSFSQFLKVLILASSLVSLGLSYGYCKREMPLFEIPALMLLAVVGMMLMVSAINLLSLYLALELQSLTLYVLVAAHRKSLRSSESALKYFVLGSLASALLLYGSSFVYGFTGSLSFQVIQAQMALGPFPPLGLVAGLVLVLSGLAFKLSAVPFHMWTPDVYEGAPTPITAFLSAAPKIAAAGLLIRFLFFPFGHALLQWQGIVAVLSVLSMLLGAFAGLMQKSIKRLMAYSSISHVGFVLMGVVVGTLSGVRSVLLYLFVYVVMVLGTFACVLALRMRGYATDKISDLSGIHRAHPVLAAVMSIFMLSMAGIPPLAGFFAKLVVFQVAVDQGLYGLALTGALASVIAAFYYLRIIKVMYFDAPLDGFSAQYDPFLRFTLLGAGVVSVALLLFFHPLMLWAGQAAASLLILPS